MKIDIKCNIYIYKVQSIITFKIAAKMGTRDITGQ